MKKHMFFLLIAIAFNAVYALPSKNNDISLISAQKLAFDDIERLLNDKKTSMRKAVVDKVLLTLKCAEKSNKDHKKTLAVIDYSLPSNKKRLWVFDLKTNALLFYTYVSHGIKSGELKSSFFSNRSNSKASSIGVFKTLFAYYGRHGYALRLSGLEDKFNSHARGRAIVMHGSWYMDEKFIKKYGRPGRSWGCPAIPLEHTKGIINSIKDDALFVAYYPNDNWFISSKYLNCDTHSHFVREEALKNFDVKPQEHRKEILFVEKNDNDLREEIEPIIVISANKYQTTFKKRAPLKRMLRRKMKNIEYIALNHDELKQIIDQNPEFIFPDHREYSQELLFVIPVVTKLRGYNATEMEIQSMGKIKAITEDLVMNEQGEEKAIYTIQRDNDVPLQVKSTSQFIRWLGL